MRHSRKFWNLGKGLWGSFINSCLIKSADPNLGALGWHLRWGSPVVGTVSLTCEVWVISGQLTSSTPGSTEVLWAGEMA